MVTNYTVLSISKCHTFPQLNGRGEHNLREFDMPHVDKSQLKNNKILVSTGGLTFPEAWKQKVLEAEVKYNGSVKRRKNSVLGIEVITSFSHEMIGKIDIEKWSEKNIQWLKDTFGEDNILSSVLHLDEETPHIHTMLVPIDDKGHLNAKSYTGGRLVMANLHTSYASYMKEFGLVRGEKKSKAKKYDKEKFYADINRIVNEEIPPIREDELFSEYQERITEYIRGLKMGIYNLECQVEKSEVYTRSRIAQEFSKYTDAVAFYDELYEKFDGDIELVRERINAYRKMELAVNAPTMAKLVEGIEQKFDIDHRINFSDIDERRKKRLLKEKEDLLAKEAEIEAASMQKRMANPDIRSENLKAGAKEEAASSEELFFAENNE